MNARVLPGTLLALTPGDLRSGDLAGCIAAVERAVDAGLRAVLVREPALSDKSFLELATAVRGVLPAEFGWLAVHDRIHLAADCGAQAVHLGFRSLPPFEARSLLDAKIAIGFSAHAGDAEHDPRVIDYLFFGPVLDTPSKRGLKEPVGFDGLARAVEGTTLPVWAIGGLRPEHCATALATGCRGIAVRGALLGAIDPARACAQFLASLAAGSERQARRTHE